MQGFWRRRGGLMGVALLGATALAACDLGAPPTTYTTATALLSDRWGQVDTAGDIDGDGDIDLVTTGQTDLGFEVLVNDGTGAFQVTTVPLTTTGTTCGDDLEETTCSDFHVVDVADVDGDGMADVVVEYHFELSVPPPSTISERRRIARLADGTGGFSQGLGIPDGEIVDVTGDGIPDVVGTPEPAPEPDPHALQIEVRPGTGDGSFGPVVVSLVPELYQRDPTNVGLGTFQFHDMNGDDATDIVVDGGCVPGAPGEGLLRGCVDLAFGDGTGHFTGGPRRVAADPAVDGIFARVVDVDDDGDLDIVGGRASSDLDGADPTDGYSVFLGDGAGGLSNEIVETTGRPTTVHGTGDFDGDGNADLLTVTDPNSSAPHAGYIRFGDGQGAFPERRYISGAVGQVADVDGDGRPDIVARHPDGVAVFLNRWDGRPD